ncbi:UNVERIFIED_CONTAM: rod shape-determining protein MreD [Prevotella sp. 15_C9]
MSIDFLKNSLWFIVLVLSQVFVLNHIHLFGVATPLLYVYFVLLYRRNYPKWAMILCGFFLGLVIDTFSNTPGVASGSMTLIATLQPFVLRPFIPRDSGEDLRPSFHSLGLMQYFWYATILTLIYNVCFFTLELFSFFNILEWLSCVLGSTAMTLFLVMIVELVRNRS